MYLEVSVSQDKVTDRLDWIHWALNTANNYTQTLSEINSHTGNRELRVFQENHICLDNTTNTPLGANETFTGDWQDVMQFQEVNVSVKADKDSAPNGLIFQWSANGVTVDDTDIFSYYTAGGGSPFTPNPAFRYFRIVFINGSQAQTVFSLQTIVRRGMTGGSFHRINDTLKDDSDARLVMSVNKLRTAANTWVSQAATNAGNAKVSLEEFESQVSDNSNTQLKTSMYGKTGDTTFQVPRIDRPTHTLQTIEYEHHEIHAGSHFFVKNYQTLSINQVLDFTFVTPNTTKWTHFLWDLATESQTNWLIYEGATITNALANALTPLNSDRNSLNASVNTLRFEVQANLAGANADTNVTGATLIASGISGVGKGGQGVSGRDSEIILKQNTIYCFRAIATSAGYINYDMEWYEHTNRTA